MKNKIRILGILLFASIIIGCTNNGEDSNETNSENALIENHDIIETLKKRATFAALAENFEFNLLDEAEKLNITSITIAVDMMTCNMDTKSCKEISKSIGDKSLIFASSEEYASLEGMSEYTMLQKGTIKINDNTHEASLYYDGKNTNDGIGFHGKIIIQMPIEVLKGEPLIIEVKGKKK